MLRNLSYWKLFALSTLIVLVASCSSELDFDRTDEIVLSPRFDLDLVFFSLETADFEDQDVVDAQITIRDTTRLEFLDDLVVQENLQEIELQYITRNSFSQSLVNTSRFLNEEGTVLYEVSFPINGAIGGEVVTTNFTRVVPEEDIDAIRNSIQVVNEVSLMTNGELISGMLTLQSRALYSLEFTGL